MANLTATSSLDEVYQLETTDPVLGGPGGISNLQPQQLLNRTKYILDRINGVLNAGGTKVPFSKVEGLGNAAGLNTGTGIGNVLITGAFGLGGDAKQCNNLNDLNSFNQGGFTVCLPGAANAPSGESGYGMMVAWRASIDYFGTVIQQVAIYGARFYFRQFITETWTGWQFITGANDVGQVSAFARNSPPTGWLRCNGADVSRTTYDRLFSAIGTTFGPGDGSTTFGLPDMRGLFMRGWDDGVGRDPGRIFGSQQGEDIGAHNHILQTITAGGGGVDGFTLAPVTNGALGIISETNIADFGGNETRPKNVAMLYCIKYK